MNITMDGKYAQRNNPTKQVRILCVDAGHKKYPVVYLRADLEPETAAADGKAYVSSHCKDDADLVPWQEPHPLKEVAQGTLVMVWDGNATEARLRRFRTVRTNSLIECKDQRDVNRHQVWDHGMTVEQYAEKYL